MAGTTTTTTMSLRNLPMSGLLCLLLLAPMTSATQFRVGGTMGWRVSEAGAESYNQWAERNRFRKADSLLFVYTAGQDSVLRVSKDDYDSCNTGTPLAKFTDRSTVFDFNQTGPFYFISGVTDNCNKGEKLVVVVMADRSNQSTVPPPPPPPPPPSAAPMKVTGFMGAVGAALGSLACFVL